MLTACTVIIIIIIIMCYDDLLLSPTVVVGLEAAKWAEFVACGPPGTLGSALYVRRHCRGG